MVPCPLSRQLAGLTREHPKKYVATYARRWNHEVAPVGAIYCIQNLQQRENIVSSHVSESPCLQTVYHYIREVVLYPSSAHWPQLLLRPDPLPIVLHATNVPRRACLQMVGQ